MNCLENPFETICRFLNRSGSTIFLAVNDQKQVPGIDHQETERMCTDFAGLGKLAKLSGHHSVGMPGRYLDLWYYFNIFVKNNIPANEKYIH